MFKKIKLIKIASVICFTGIAFAASDIDEKLDRLLDNQKVILTRLQKLEKTQNDIVRKVNSAPTPAGNKNNKFQNDDSSIKKKLLHFIKNYSFIYYLIKR